MKPDPPEHFGHKAIQDFLKSNFPTQVKEFDLAGRVGVFRTFDDYQTEFSKINTHILDTVSINCFVLGDQNIAEILETFSHCTNIRIGFCFISDFYLGPKIQDTTCYKLENLNLKNCEGLNSTKMKTIAYCLSFNESLKKSLKTIDVTGTGLDPTEVYEMFLEEGFDISLAQDLNETMVIQNKQ